MNSVGVKWKVSLLSHSGPLADEILNCIYRAGQGLFTTSFPQKLQSSARLFKAWEILEHTTLTSGGRILHSRSTLGVDQDRNIVAN